MDRASRFIVYGLCDPITDELRYIGKSSNGLSRPKRHITLIEKPRTHKQRWINGLLRAGVAPEIVVLEVLANASELDEWERWWIAYWRFIGGRLTNATDGGDGWAVGDRNPMRNPEARERHRAAMKGRPFSPQHKRNHALAVSAVKVRDLTGQRFGRLVVVEQKGRRWSKVIWLCDCDCGKQISTLGVYLTNGDTKSCGCLSERRPVCPRGHERSPDRECRVCGAAKARRQRARKRAERARLQERLL